MRYSVSVILVCILVVFSLTAGCAGDINVQKKVGDFGSTFGASAEEQNAISWFTQKYGDPRVDSGKPPQFVEPLITSGLTANQMPVNKITVFPVNGGSVYFWVFYQQFKKGTPITVTWTYMENGNVVSTVNQQTGDTYGRLVVEFQKPDSGWGKGRQRITVSGSGATATVDFTIGDSMQTVPLPYTGTGATTTSQPVAVTTQPVAVTTVTTATSSAPANAPSWVLKDVTYNYKSQLGSQLGTKDKPVDVQCYTTWGELSSTSGTGTAESTKINKCNKNGDWRSVVTWNVPPQTLTPGGTFDVSGTLTRLEYNPYLSQSDSLSVYTIRDGKGLRSAEFVSVYSNRLDGPDPTSLTRGATATVSATLDVPKATTKLWSLRFETNAGNVDYNYVPQS